MDSVDQRLPDETHLAFRILFTKFYRPLLGFFIKRGCSEAEAEDFVQETLLNAYRGFSKFRRDASDATWIFSIACNLWLNHLRSQRAKKRGVRPVSLESLENDEIEQSQATRPAPESTALDEILEDERRSRLRTAIRDLPEGRRHALQLRLLHGLKYREIANVLAIEVNTVKSQIFQAKKQLEERLTQEESLVSGKGSP